MSIPSALPFFRNLNGIFFPIFGKHSSRRKNPLREGVRRRCGSGKRKPAHARFFRRAASFFPPASRREHTKAKATHARRHIAQNKPSAPTQTAKTIFNARANFPFPRVLARAGTPAFSAGTASASAAGTNSSSPTGTYLLSQCVQEVYPAGVYKLQAFC